MCVCVVSVCGSGSDVRVIVMCVVVRACVRACVFSDGGACVCVVVAVMCAL